MSLKKLMRFTSKGKYKVSLVYSNNSKTDSSELGIQEAKYIGDYLVR